MKLAKLVNGSEKSRRINARFVKVVGYKAGRDAKGFATAIAKTWTPKEFKAGRIVEARDQNRYVSSIKWLDKNLNVKVSCSCPDYTFAGWEYANHQQGAADIVYGNGEPPLEKNPNLKPGLCIAKNALITTIHGEKLIQDVDVGDMVLTLDGYREVIAAARTGTKPVSALRSTRGHTVLMTPEHEILTMRDGYFSWLPAQDLHAGDPVFQMTAEKQVQHFPTVVPSAVVTGILMAEGDEFGYAPVEPVVREIFERYYRQVFDADPRYQNATAQHLLLKNSQKVAAGLGFELTSSDTQRIPARMLTQGKDFKVSLLYGLFLGDGHVSKDGAYASFGTTSRGLAHDVQQLIRSLGMYSAIRRNGTDQLWHVRIGSQSMAQFRACLSNLKFKYKIKAHVPGNSGLDTSLSGIPLETLFADLRTAAHDAVTRKPDERSYHVRIGKDSLLNFLKEMAPEEIILVQQEGAKKPGRYCPKEIRAWAERCTTMSAQVKALVPALPEYRSKSKLLAWLAQLKIRTEQSHILETILRSSATVEYFHSLREVKEAQVYDLEIKDAHHFIANGFVVHNCKHLLALRALVKAKNGV